MGNKICLPFPHFLGELGRDKDNEMLDHKDVRSNHGTDMLKDILGLSHYSWGFNNYAYNIMTL